MKIIKAGNYVLFEPCDNGAKSVYVKCHVEKIYDEYNVVLSPMDSNKTFVAPNSCIKGVFQTESQMEKAYSLFSKICFEKQKHRQEIKNLELKLDNYIKECESSHTDEIFKTLNADHLMLGDLNIETTLVVDWSKALGYDECTEIVQYKVCESEFYVLKNGGVWKSTNYNSIEEIIKNGGDVIWVK